MKNSHEEAFNRELMDVPALPQNLYKDVERGIREKQRLHPMAWAAAALVLLSFATLYYLRPAYSDPAVENRRAIVEEDLNAIRTYFNGQDIDEELTAYAVIDPDIFNFNQTGGTDEDDAY